MEQAEEEHQNGVLNREVFRGMEARNQKLYSS
jgi:hypothetical protein